MRDVERRALDAYQDSFGEEPELLVSSPGRVNLIGEHTDYNGGFVLPCAIDRRVAVAMGHGGNELFSADFGEASTVSGENEGVWKDYPSGVAWAMSETGHEIDSFRAAFAGDVPLGAGLSSSAAIEAATALALNELFGLGVDRKKLATLCRKAENEFVGVQSGIMDQYASLLCEQGAALFVDCRSLEAQRVPLDLEAADLELLVCDTRVHHAHVSSGYNDRRKTCEDAAKSLGVESLREASEEDLQKLSGEEFERARHIVTENTRVLEAFEALRARNYREFGRLMYASHESMRDDFEISVPEIDTFVELSQNAGAVGARLTGGGFGGCAIALIETAKAEALAETARRRFEESASKEPTFYEFRASAGAEVVQRTGSSDL